MTNNDNMAPGGDAFKPCIVSLWTPIKMCEVKGALPANTTSAGPDGLIARPLKKVPKDIIARILNIIM